DTRWYERGSVIELLKFGWHVTNGIRQARKFLKEFKPDLIIGTGGFVCFPVIFAGHRLGIRCYVHEQNAFPGLSNRKLEKYVRKIFLGFKEGGEYFTDKDKLIVSGNPVRQEFFTLDKEAARERLGIGRDDFVILIFGGSLGAETIDKIGVELVNEMNGRPGETLIFGTGKWFYDQVQEQLSGRGIIPAENIRLTSYIDNMQDCLAACDVVISRAGALSMAEAMAQGKASILIPSPNVSANHQFYNAKAAADCGAAFMIEEKDVTPEKVIEMVRELKEDPSRALEMGKKAKALAPSKATDIIYEEIMKDAGLEPAVG
ncbi:MAG: UDP-N-acetylglucosamine--N-acetylmuramyl-(pentapeptide) pyrophosphoryl-undecaprenol N-acetylglucosamine transferase, partial [Firmicutes bacterium]|nr:UDP-N-acetylglucosamine--N-acetylmuramyl-(pentapeptide) pyrophosphoryl-undecaprenol N-acetylglucosamine transferase [Bacillota bacterium]